jgi:hypothetical protein
MRSGSGVSRISASRARARRFRSRLADCGQQYFVIEWFRREFDRTALHSLHRHRHIATASDEDVTH